MFRTASLTILAAAILGSAAAYSKAPASAPAGTTGMCKDGSYTSAASKSGACSGHDGVKKWYGAPAAASTAPASSDKGSSSGKSKSKHKAESTEAPAASASAPAAEASTAKASSSGKSKAGSSATSTASAATPPAAATGTCKDGSATTAATKSGACSGHGGVKEWYAAGSAGAAAASAPMSRSAAAPAAALTKSTYTPPAQPASGGGQGQVWVNKPSKVYHCPGDQWYGKTKDGAYMSEANAIAQGYRADHGKACQ